MKAQRFWVVFIAATALAQPATIQVTVQKQESAQQQLAVARRLIALVPMTMGKPGYERHFAVANAAANLEAIERGWPHDREAIVEANALLARLYADAEMPQNAIDAATHGLALAPNDHRLHFAMALAQKRLGHLTDAAQAFARADATFDDSHGEPIRNVGELNTIAFFYETEKQYPDCARVLRRMANLPASTPLDRLVFSERALEATMKTPDRDAARADLEMFRAAYRAMLGVPRTPGGQAIINQSELEIAHYEALLR
jgi:tetratricopeptide (TPR) repeat protein